MKWGFISQSAKTNLKPGQKVPFSITYSLLSNDLKSANITVQSKLAAIETEFALNISVQPSIVAINDVMKINLRGTFDP